MNRVAIQTPSRLHFGLLGWGPRSRRQFGGVGLMIERPGLELSVTRAPSWSSSGSFAERALEVARSVVPKLIPAGVSAGPFGIEIAHAMASHAGLGSGTQLCLAVARAIAAFGGIDDPNAELLARVTDRGRRSGIGIHGFARGGLIVDAGRSAGGAVPTCLTHLHFPKQWSILVVIPGTEPGIHGMRELEAFERVSEMPGLKTDHICRLVLLGLLPAVIEADLPAFGAALEEMQDVVGSCFTPVQGGRFASPSSEPIAAAMRASGLVGIGQSSWGPCLYGFSDQSPVVRDPIRLRLREQFQLADDRILWTLASANGAIVRLD